MMPHETLTITPPTWRPIEDLPIGWERMHTDQLRSLGEVWRLQREAQLDDSTVLQEFNERLSRQWAIETGIIEGLYTIDRGTTQVLIEHGIVEKNIPHTVTNNPLTLVEMLKDHESVLEGAFDFVKQNRSLSTSYIKEMHAALTRHQLTTEAKDSLGRIVQVSLLHGEWKKLPNNPTRPDGQIHPYCPPTHVAAEMDRLVAMHLEHEEQGVTPEIEAAWLHHRFTQIHPFQDGNGRVVRVLASLVFLKAGWFPLMIDRSDRNQYLDALESADRGDLVDLITLFERVQAREFFSAFASLDQVSRSVHAEDPAASEGAKSEFAPTAQASLDSRFGLVDVLKNLSYDALLAKAQLLLGQSGTFSGDSVVEAVVKVSGESDSRGYGFVLPTEISARQNGYFANTLIYSEWAILYVRTKRGSANITFSFHGFGRRFIGLFAVGIFVQFHDPTHIYEGLPQPTFHYEISPFIFASDEARESAVSRFNLWFDSGLARATEYWQQV